MGVIALRPTLEADLDYVLALEGDPANAPFIGQWSRDEHRAAIARADREHWIVCAGPTRDRAGYLIAFDLRAHGCGVYVKRIVSDAKGKGVGREALRAFAAHAFADLGAPYLWLSVRPGNVRGERCYRAIGFRELVADPEEIARHDRVAERSSAGSLRMVLRP